MRKALVPNKVSKRVLREGRKKTVHKIQIWIASLLKEGIVQFDWKCADIVPKYKRGIMEQPMHYRPVSLTIVVGQLSETIREEFW